jgi:hypothetical protein
MPATLPDLSDNQTVADAIAARLRHDGQLRHYTIDIVVQDGIARVSGAVADGAQRSEVLRIVRAVPGIVQVQDGLVLASHEQIIPVQAAPPLPGLAPSPPPKVETAPPPAGAPPAVPPSALPPGAGAPPMAGTDPVPMGSGPSGPYDFVPPKMPPYAWPTYAPYNNYSRVAYPQYYPYNAWPFIGPVYPFPRVPLGWRSVKLEWEDGHWWFSRTATPHDWWRIKYW